VSTDKDGLILGLLARKCWRGPAAIPARFTRSSRNNSSPVYERIDAPATPEQKTRLAALSPEQVTATEFAGDPSSQLNRAPSNGAPLADSRWLPPRMVRRASFRHRGRLQIYAESFAGETHLRQIQTAAQELVEKTVGK